MSSETDSTHKKLSSSLKERLKRCGRYHSSPIGPPSKKHIYYPACTLPQTPVSTETSEMGHNHRATLLSPAKLGVACVDDEESETGYDKSHTPSKLEKLKIDSTTYAKRKNISTFTSPSESLNQMVNSFKSNDRNRKPVDPRLSPENQERGVSEISSAVSIAASPNVFDEKRYYLKRESEGIGQVELCSSTPDTARLTNKRVTMDESGDKMSNQIYQRTPIRSRNMSSCKPSRLHFPGMSDISYKENETEVSLAVSTQMEEVDSQITPAEEAQNGAKSVCNSDSEMLQEKYKRLKNTLIEKEEELRKLKMVKMYRTKNDLDSLGVLVSKWRMTSQQALLDLHNKLPDPKPSLTQLIDHLQIEHSLVHFNPEEETFN